MASTVNEAERMQEQRAKQNSDPVAPVYGNSVRLIALQPLTKLIVLNSVSLIVRNIKEGTYLGDKTLQERHSFLGFTCLDP